MYVQILEDVDEHKWYHIKEEGETEEEEEEEGVLSVFEKC